MDFLEQAVRTERIVCVDAPEHEDESLVAKDREDILAARRTLSMGIDFRGWQETLWSEAHAIAAEFVGGSLIDLTWKEGFRKDPQSPREKLYPGGFQVNVDMGIPDWRVESVVNQKRLESNFDDHYAADRAKGWAHEKLLSGLFNDMVDIHMRPLFDPKGYQEMFLKLGDQIEAEDPTSEKAMKLMDQLLDLQLMRQRCEDLHQLYPGIAKDILGFKLALTRAPTIAYPAIFRTALIETPNRKSKPGDGFDIKHLTNGLSRCDFVTCDGGMAQLCKNNNLVPAGCQLFSYRDHGALLSAIESAV